MSDEGASGDDVGGDDDSLGALLDRKQDGVAVLVTGPVPAAVHRSMSARLLGSPDLDRRRVIGLTAPTDGSVDDRLPPGASTSPGRLRTVVGNGWARSSASVAGTSTDAGAGAAPGAGAGAAETPTPATGSQFPGVDTLPPDGVTVLEDSSLSAFGERLAREVTTLDQLADGLDPGQLRLCVDSVDQLVHDNDDDAVLRFAHLLADQVRRHDGMLHLHTTHRRDDLAVAELADVTEVVLRLRLTGEAPEFRPYLDGDPLADWGPIPGLPD